MLLLLITAVIRLDVEWAYDTVWWRTNKELTPLLFIYYVLPNQQNIQRPTQLGCRTPHRQSMSVYTHTTFILLIVLFKSENFSSSNTLWNSDLHEVINKQNSKKLTLPYFLTSTAEDKASKSFFEICSAFSFDKNPRVHPFTCIRYCILDHYQCAWTPPQVLMVSVD